jgi:hypothetical protein
MKNRTVNGLKIQFFDAQIAPRKWRLLPLEFD